MKTYFLSFLLLLGGFWSWGQCPTGNITLTTQGQVDSFGINYPGCTEVLGNLVVGTYFTFSNINNLNGLQGLVSINGGLDIIQNNLLIDLNGLNSITSIGGNLNVGNNEILTNFQGLNALTAIGGRLWVQENGIISFQGLNGLISIGNYLNVYGNDKLTSLQGLNGVTSIGNHLYIVGNDSLTSLQELNGITSIGGDLLVNFNNALTSLQGLNSITSIGGDFSVHKNITLTSIHELESLTAINGTIHIKLNPLLSNCALNPICQMLAINHDSVTIENNLAGCDTQEEVGMTCSGLGSASGQAYVDINCNNQFDTITDKISPFLLLRNSGDNFPIATTNTSGNYIKFLISNTTLEYYVAAPTGFTTHPDSYMVTTDTTPQQFPNKDFSLCPDSLFHNLKTTLTSVTVPRPGFTNQYQICVQNLGTQPENAVLTLDFSIGPGAQYITITNAAGGTIQNNIITWNINDLQLFDSECFTVTIQLATNTPLGIYLQPTANVSLTPTQTETILSDNLVALNDQVVGSYDPNDKTVDMPNITYDPTSGVTRLQYKIRFQNTGTFYATFIEVLDTLESKLDIRTLEMVAASHDYTLSFPSPNLLKWRFDDINLPDSTSNEPESHGFIVFNISTITPINLGEVVQNRAGIYFDFNEPVITNYATTSFTVGVHDPFGLGSLPLSIAPNPTQDNITLRYTLTESADSELLITNAQGVVVQSLGLGKQGVGDYALPISLEGLPDGLYLVTVRVGGRVGVGKVVRL